LHHLLFAGLYRRTKTQDFWSHRPLLGRVSDAGRVFQNVLWDKNKEPMQGESSTGSLRLVTIRLRAAPLVAAARHS
jgi:hypothetical protein